MKANQRLNKSHKYLLKYTKKVWKKRKKLEKARKCPGPTRPAARIVQPDPTRARISKTRPDLSPHKSGSKPSLTKRARGGSNSNPLPERTSRNVCISKRLQFSSPSPPGIQIREMARMTGRRGIGRCGKKGFEMRGDSSSTLHQCASWRIWKVFIFETNFCRILERENSSS